MQDEVERVMQETVDTFAKLHRDRDALLEACKAARPFLMGEVGIRLDEAIAQAAMPTAPREKFRACKRRKRIETL